MQGEVSGFFNAPFTKFWLSSSLAISAAVAAGKWDSILVVRAPFLTPQMRYIVHPFILPTTQDMLFGAVLMYSFRTLERRLGSRKFSAAVLIMAALSTAIQAGAGTLLNSSVLHPCSTSLMFALSTVYLLTVPKSQLYTLGAQGAAPQNSWLSVSDKIYIYLMLLQLATSSGTNSYIAAAAGFIAGISYKAGFSRVAFPASVGKFAAGLFGWFHSRAPTLAAQNRRLRTVSGTAEPYEERLLGGDDDDIPQQLRVPWREPLHEARRSASEAQAPSEESIEELVTMGFSRPDAEQALRNNGNNLARATEWLLRDS